MKIGTGIIIFFLALIALIAEIVLYFIFGIGAAVSGSSSSLPGIAAFFVWLMIMTIVIGVASPIAALIEQLTKKENLSLYILLPTVGLIGLGLGALLLIIGLSASSRSTSKTAANQNSTNQNSSTSSAAANDAGTQYIDKIQIRNLEVGTTVLREPGVFGELKNTGDRSVKRVDITIYFLDNSGNPVAEKTYSPIYPDTIMMDQDHAPLKPNHARKFGYRADDAPSDWARKVTARVVKVEFED